MIRFRHALLTGLAILTALPLGAQQVKIRGQLRPRSEARTPTAPGKKTFTSMRVRFGIEAALDRNVRVVVQLQDVRLWGEEKSTLFDFTANQFDLHQGYADIGSFSEDKWAFRAGRQEVKLGGERLIGPVGWTQQAQSFDGVRLRTRGSWGLVDFFGYKTAEIAASADAAVDSELLGAYATFKTGEKAGLDVYGILQSSDGVTDTDEVTLGARLAGKTGIWSYRAEGSYQVGTRADTDVSAFMFGGRVGADVAEGKGTITLWYDYLSGDDNPTDGKVKVFQTIAATNHKFYGFADLFLNIPVHTGGLGLQDFALKGVIRANSEFRVGIDLHAFRTAKQGTLSTSNLAEEIDVTGWYTFSKNVTFQGGVSYVAQGDALAELGRLSEDLWWSYLQMAVTF
jgi:alginate export protein